MSHIDIDQESAALAGAFDGFLDSLTPEMKSASQTLIAKSGIGDGTSHSWNGRFKPLTLLYPILQTESMASINIPLARDIALYHQCLVVFGFIDDRVNDGQIQLDEPEENFIEKLFSTASHGLSGSLTDCSGTAFKDTISQIMRSCRQAQAKKYCAPEKFLPDPLSPHTCSLIGERALYGFISVLSAARLNGTDVTGEHELRRSFDWIATGLQWVDDIQDIGEDLRLDEENLVLHLALGPGLDGYGLHKGGRAESEIVAELAQAGILTDAVELARKAFVRGAELNESIGASQLASILRARLDVLDRLDAVISSLGAL